MIRECRTCHKPYEILVFDPSKDHNFLCMDCIFDMVNEYESREYLKSRQEKQEVKAWS